METYEPKDVAALLVLFFRNSSSNGEPYADLDEQLRASANLSPDPAFQDVLTAIHKVQAERPHVIHAARMAIRAVVLELVATRQWGTCKLINPDHVRRILNF